MMNLMIFRLSFNIILLVTTALVPAADAKGAPAPTDAAVLGDFERRNSICTLTAASQVSSSKKSCATIVLSNIVVTAGQTLDLTGLDPGTSVIFSGTTTFGYSQWSGPLISISGTSITVSGTSGHVIDGNGAAWWDGQGSIGGRTKPKLFYAHNMKQSTISGLNIKDTPVQCFSIDSATELTIQNVVIDNSAGDSGSLGHNTDGFDIGSSTNVQILNTNVANQDDCVAINSGTEITIKGLQCSGGHGLSIGSVGGHSSNTVFTVTIENSVVTNSQNGIRIKTVAGATGNVSDVTFSSITMSGISNYGIVIQQDYKNGSPTGIPTTGVPITGLTVSNIKGSVSSSAKGIYILCGSGSCSNWKWSEVSITGGKKSAGCENVPSGASC